MATLLRNANGYAPTPDMHHTGLKPGHGRGLGKRRPHREDALHPYGFKQVYVPCVSCGDGSKCSV